MMYMLTWSLCCEDCAHTWGTVLPDDTDPDFNGDRCPECNGEAFSQSVVART